MIMTFEQIQRDHIAAMKEGLRIKKQVLADIITTAKNMAIAQKCKDDISEEIVTTAIQKCHKICLEQIETCPLHRPELREDFEFYLYYLKPYLPKMMDEAEVREYIASVVETFQPISAKSRGPIMKAIMPHLKGKADGKLISDIVMEYFK